MIPLAGLMGRFEQAPVLDMATKEVVGINAGKIAFTRTNDERIDSAISELGNTAGTFGGGVAVNSLTQRILKSSPNPKIAAAGSSIAFFSMLFSFMWAMPFIRNYLTTKRTGSTQFSQVIGGQQQGQQSQDPTQLQAALNGYRNKAAAILGLGAAGAAASVLAAKGNWQALSKMPNWLVMKDGAFKNITKPQALWFWGLPAYGGWIHASRDNYERKEQLLKFAAFVGAFFGPQVLLDKAFQSKFSALKGEKASLENIVNHGAEKITAATEREKWGKIIERAKAPLNDEMKQMVKSWRNKNLWGLGASVVLLGVLPQVLNIFLTKRRMQVQEQGQPASPSLAGGQAPQGVPRGNLQYKPLQSWGGARVTA